MRLPRLSLYTAFLWLPVTPSSARPQVVLDWSEFRICEDCELPVRELVRLGDIDGPGIIRDERSRVVATPGRGFLVFDEGGTEIRLFDARGRFRRAFGRSGDGPGEFRHILGAVFSASAHVMAFDLRRRAWLKFTEDGDFVSEVPQRSLRPGPFRMLPGDTLAVVGVFDGRPENVGYPLHVVNVAFGLPIRHFGAGDSQWMATHSQPAVLLEEADRVRRSSVWWGSITQPHFEQWSIDGTDVRAVTGDLPWFEDGPSGPVVPEPGVMSFGVDSADRLWLMSRVPDPEWRRVAALGGIEPGIPMERLDQFFDARLDVFDLARRKHLGSLHWDAITTNSLVKRGGEVLVASLEYQEPTWPRLVLYEAVVP